MLNVVLWLLSMMGVNDVLRVVPVAALLLFVREEGFKLI